MFYANGQEYAHYASGGSVPIPKDAADGGTNLSLGAGVTGTNGASVSIYSMSYSAHNSDAVSEQPD